MLRYYNEPQGRINHIYLEYEGSGNNLGGIKWVVTTADRVLATWLVDHLNKTQGNITGEIITVASLADEVVDGI
jgi:hypothetical protein